MGEAVIKKLYDIRLVGEQELVTGMDKVNKSFDQAKKTFQELKKMMGGNTLKPETEEMKKQREEYEKARIEYMRQRTLRQEMLRDSQALRNAIAQERLEQQRQRQTNEAVAGSYDYFNKILREGKLALRGMVIGSEEYIEKLRELLPIQELVNNHNRSFTKDGLLVGEYTSGIIKAFQQSGLDFLIQNQVDKTKAEIQTLDDAFEELRRQMLDLREAGEEGLESLEQQMIENRNEASQLRDQLSGVEAELRGFGSIGQQVTEGIGAGFRSFRNELVQMAIGYAGINAIFDHLRENIAIAKELADTTSDLELELGRAAGGADDLVQNLSKLDTRTKLTGLENISVIASRAGTAEKNLLGVTEAIDKTSIAFGKDFGSIEEGTETFAKLINIFYDDREITGERILKIGNSIRTLANETVASVPYINDFNGRMAGLKQLFTGFKLSDSIGLGAGFEEFKQSAETSSTVLVKVLPKMAADAEKYAKIIGITKKEFSDLINNNPTEALLQVSEALVKTKGGVEGVSNAFADSELGSGRITTILATLGGKADVFRERIKRAGETINETGSIEEAFQRKNENLAATMDKLSKKFSDAANSSTFKATLTAIATVVLVLLNNLPLVLSLLGLLTLAWGVQNAQLILLNAQLILYNIRLGLSYIALGLLTVAQTIYNGVLYVTDLALKLVTGTMALFGVTVTAATGPIRIMIGVLALLGAALYALTRNAKENISALRSRAAELRVMAEVEKRVADATGEQISKIKVLTAVVNDQNLSIYDRLKALNELIKISPKYKEVLNGETIDTIKLKKVTDELTESLKKQARAKAIADLTKEKEKRKFDIENEIEIVEKLPDQKETGFGAFAKNLASGLGYGKGTKQQQLRKLNNDLGDVEADLNNLYDRVSKNKDLQDAIINKVTGNGNEDKNNDNESASKLTGMQKDFLKDLDAKRDEELANVKINRAKNLIDEETFLKQSLAINTKYIDQKLDFLKNRATPEERKVYAELRLERINNEQETNEKLLEIRKKALEQQFENAKAAAQESLSKVEDDPNVSEVKKLEAKKQYNLDILNAQIEFNNQMDQAEKDYAQKSVNNEQSRQNSLLKQQRDFNKTIQQLEEAKFKELLSNVKYVESFAKNTIEIEIQQKRLEILSNKRLSNAEREAELQKLNTQQSLKQITAESDAIKKQLLLYQMKLGVFAILDENVQKLLADLAKLTADQKELENNLGKNLGEKLLPSDESTKQIIKQKIAKLFDWKEDDGETMLLGNLIADSYDLASTAMNNYFDAERSQIEQSKKVAIERLELEKKQRQDRAQSKAEVESIEKQFATKKEAEEKKAFEKNKKLQIAQAQINLATQLSNLAVIAFGPSPLNIATLGTAGAIMYAIQAAMAFANYQMNVSKINSAKYAKGGEVPTGGGEFGGNPHSNGGTPFSFQGQSFEAEAKELAIINKKSAQDPRTYTITGTTKQIASKLNEMGGGVSFANGARLNKFAVGGYLGGNVQPPVFNSYKSDTSKSYQSKEDLDALKEMIIQTSKDVETTNKTIKSLKVQLVTQEVTESQNKIVKKTEVGTL